MIDLIPHLPSDTVGLRAVGKVSADDYTNTIYPALEKAFAAHDEINLIYILGKQLEHYTPGAALKDAEIGLRTRPRAWNRVALVTDEAWIDQLLGLAKILYPIDLRKFTTSQEAEAIAWASGDKQASGTSGTS